MKQIKSRVLCLEVITLSGSILRALFQSSSQKASIPQENCSYRERLPHGQVGKNGLNENEGLSKEQSRD